MISLVNLIVSTDESEINQTPINQSFGEGVHYLPASQKRIFDICSFSFVGIDEGSFLIDDLEITNDASTLGRIIVYRIAVEGFASLSAVFILPEGLKAAISKRREISGSIASLRDLPADSLEDKAGKLSALFDILEKENASYVLLDAGVKANNENKEAIDKILSQKRLTTLVMTFVPVPVQKEAKPKIVIDEEGDFSRFAKKEASPFVFEGIFSAIDAFAFNGGVCLVSSGSVGLGTALLVVSFICAFMVLSIINTIYIDAIKHLQNKSSYKKIQILSCFSVLISYAIGMLISYLCYRNNIVLPENGAFGLSIALSSLLWAILIVFSVFLSWPTKIWEKVKRIFRKK